MTNHTTTPQPTLHIAPRAIATQAIAALRRVPAVRAVGNPAVAIGAADAWQHVTIHSLTHLTLLLTLGATADIPAVRNQIHTALVPALSRWLGEPVTVDIHIVALAADA